MRRVRTRDFTVWILLQNWFQFVVQCASHRDRAGILAVVEVYAHVVLWRFLPFSGPAGWLPKADSYANTMAYSVKNNHEISKYFQISLCVKVKSWNLTFWNLLSLKDLTYFVSIIDESQSNIMNELAEVICFSDKHSNIQNY